MKDKYLEKALHILQNIDTTVTEVCLLRNLGRGTFEGIFVKHPCTLFLFLLLLPFYLQVPEV